MCEKYPNHQKNACRALIRTGNITEVAIALAVLLLRLVPFDRGQPKAAKGSSRHRVTPHGPLRRLPSRRRARWRVRASDCSSCGQRARRVRVAASARARTEH